MVGSSWSRDFDCNDTFWHPNVGCGMDYFMFRLENNGNILWDSSYGGSGNEWIYGAVLDSRDSSIVINGSTYSNDFMVTGYHGNGDYWVIKTDKNGKLLWQKCLGDSLLQDAYGICNTQNGYMAYGSTGPGSIGQTDGWIFQLDMLGNSITNKQFGGLHYEDPASILAFKNGFIATGASNSLYFTEGKNISFLPGADADAYFTYISNVPCEVRYVNYNTCKQIIAYPNPIYDKVNILLPNKNGNIVIKNYFGKNIYQRKIVETDKVLDVNTTNWSKGLYIIEWIDDDGTFLTNKIIIY